jgi:hypothetical protein
MKKILTSSLLLAAVYVNGQDYYTPGANKRISEPEATTCLTVGILQGGGSLVGADLEVLMSKRFGAQIGAGLVGFGGGINFHLEPGIRSSFLSLQYWNQGIGSSFVQSLVGPSYVYRGRKWFTFSAGLGALLEISEENNPYDTGEEPEVILTYSIGVFIPW